MLTLSAPNLETSRLYLAQEEETGCCHSCLKIVLSCCEQGINHAVAGKMLWWHCKGAGTMLKNNKAVHTQAKEYLSFRWLIIALSTEFGLGLIIGLGAICLYAFITENQALKTVIILVVGLKYAIRAYNPMVKIVLSAWLWCHGKNPMEYEFRASSNWGAGE